MTAIADGSLVVVNGSVGRVVRADRFGGADGYMVSLEPEFGDGYLPHFVYDTSVRLLDPDEDLCLTWPPECGRIHSRHPSVRHVWAKLQAEQRGVACPVCGEAP